MCVEIVKYSHDFHTCVMQLKLINSCYTITHMYVRTFTIMKYTCSSNMFPIHTRRLEVQLHVTVIIDATVSMLCDVHVHCACFNLHTIKLDTLSR